MTDTKHQTYVVNLDFDGGDLGEIISAPPAQVADWEDAGFISPVDENGNRLVAVTHAAVDPSSLSTSPRNVTIEE